VTLGAAFIAIVAYAAFRFTYYKNAALRFLRSWPGILLMMGGGFLFVGEFFEKNELLIHHAFFEEISELFGYVCILLSAFSVNSCMGHRPIPSRNKQETVEQKSKKRLEM